MGLLDYIKETIELNKKYYESLGTQSTLKSSTEKPKTENEIWPFDNSIDIKTLTRAQQHERELKIQMYMEAYPFLPFQVCDSRLYRPNTSWCSLNMTGQRVALLSLKELAQLVLDFRENENVIPGFLPKDMYMPYTKICFDPSNIVGETARTFLEYQPITKAGKRSSTPLVLHFTTVKDYTSKLLDECGGELTYGLDGAVCSAKVRIFKNEVCFSYDFGIVGRTFTITKITTPSPKDGKIVLLYSSQWDFMEY